MACRNVVGCLLLSLPFQSEAARQAPPAYTPSIAPILRDKCAACHNHTLRQGGLNLESYESLMSGANGGAVIVPGRSAESRLVQMIEGTRKPRMPIGEPLGPDAIRAIRAWIDAGAIGPDAPPSPLAEPDAASALGALGAIPAIAPRVPVNAAVASLAYQHGGGLLAAGRYQTVELFHAGTRKAAGSLAGPAGQVRALAFSPDGRLLAGAGGAPAQFGEIKIWDVAGQKELRTIRGHRDNIFAIAFNPRDGGVLASCSYDRLIKLWDVTSGRELKTLKDHTDAVFQIAFSPDGARLASASADRTLKLWDTATGERLYTLGDALDAVHALAFHPSGRWLAGAGADRTIRIWELGEREGRQVYSLIAHEDAINQLAFSPDGRLLATTGADRRIKFWRLSNPAAGLREAHPSELQPDWIYALSFSPDGKRLAAGRHDGSLLIYDPVTGRQVRTTP